MGTRGTACGGPGNSTTSVSRTMFTSRSCTVRRSGTRPTAGGSSRSRTTTTRSGGRKMFFFSSGAESPIELRSPTDVANLAFVFGLTEEQGKNAVNAACHKISRVAVGRKMGPFRVRIEKVENVDASLVPEESEEEEEESGESSDEDLEQN